MFIDDDALTAALEAELKKASGTLATAAPYWPAIITRANADAYSEIKTRLLHRGLTAAQVDTWDRGAEFQTSIGLYWCLQRGAGLHNYDKDAIDKFDRRWDLDDTPVYIGGEQVGRNNAW